MSKRERRSKPAGTRTRLSDLYPRTGTTDGNRLSHPELRGRRKFARWCLRNGVRLR